MRVKPGFIGLRRLRGIFRLGCCRISTISLSLSSDGWNLGRWSSSYGFSWKEEQFYSTNQI